MKVALTICGVLLSLCMSVAGQELQSQCGDHPRVLRDNSRQLRWFTSEELYGIAKTVVKPEPVPLPGGMPYTGTVSAKILVNTAGEVVCIWRVAGHPVMIPVAVRAIHEWKFTPMIVDGKAVEFVGTLKVPVYSPPHSKN